LVYNLDPYQLDAGFTPNALDSAASQSNALNFNSGTGVGMAVALLTNAHTPPNAISSNNQLEVEITGYRYGSTNPSSTTVTFSSNSAAGVPIWQTAQGQIWANVTSVELVNYAVPNGGVEVDVWETTNTAALAPVAYNAMLASNAIEMAQLKYESTDPTLLYSVPQYSYKIAPETSTVTYTGEQNNVNFAITPSSYGTGARNQYYSYAINEIDVPGSTSVASNVVFGITNSSLIGQGQAYWLNDSSGNNNAATYYSTQYGTSTTSVKATAGFRTERGGELASISTQQAVYDEPKQIDGLTFVVGPASASSNSLTTATTSGPYSVGQSTNIPNVTIANVTAKCAFTTSSCSVSGLSNLSAVPSVSQAVVPTTLNTAVTPLAVLDSNANAASTLIVVGSKYVNSVAGQIFAQNPSFNQSFGQSSVVVQAFGTNRVLVAGYSASQTVTAGNQFIQDLLANATV